MTHTAEPAVIEYALMVERGPDEAPEFVPAKDAEHAEHMARTIYAPYPTWTVGREVAPWRYVRRADFVLGELTRRAR